MPTLIIGESPLSPAEVAQAVANKTRIDIAPAAMTRLKAARAVVDRIVADGTPVYGVNTGVGSQKDHAVPQADIPRYNRDLIRAHGTRVPGPVASDDAVRASLILMINEHCLGHSGISPKLVMLLVTKLNEGVIPKIDASGSVGASDLVPLAQIGDWVLSDPRAEYMQLPGAKDALSLINCNAFSLAHTVLCLADLRVLLTALELSAALSLEGFRANVDASLPKAARTTARAGQNSASAFLAKLLEGSSLLDPTSARFLQDPLSFRNVTQILGAVRECRDWLDRVVADEIASGAVNPLIDPGDGVARSHGNMDATRLTLSLDMMRQALGKAVDVCGERIHKQQWPAFSGLPIGLAKDETPTGGVQFLNLGHIAASLIASVKIWAAPHLLHSVGQVADGVEDTASNAVHAVSDLARQIDAGFKIAALEAAVSIWAIRRRGLSESEIGSPLRPVYATLVQELPIEREGHSVFDLAVIVTRFRASADRLCSEFDAEV